MNKKTIKHVWFDFTDTIASMEKAEFEKLVYGAYAEVVGKEITLALEEEYKTLLKTQKSNAAVFKSLGLPSDYLSGRAADSKNMFHLTDPHIPEVIQKLKDIVPISVFSNTRLDVILPALGLDIAWFVNILGPDVVKNPKPALDGFHKMVELSGVFPQEILYIGDDVEKDLVPAKQVGLLTGLLWKESDVPNYCFKDFQDISKIWG